MSLTSSPNALHGEAPDSRVDTRMSRGALLQRTVAALGVASMMVSAPTAQGPSGSAAASTASAHPDFSGMWSGGGLTIERGYDGNMGTGYYQDFFAGTDLGRPASAVPAAKSDNQPPGDQFVIGSGAETPDRRIPFQPWARAKKEANYKAIYNPAGAATFDEVDPVARCLPTGVPRAQYISIGSYQILQTREYFAVFGEWNHQRRLIPLDGRPHLDPHIRLWNGDSRGHWEGQTLVVDTTNLTSNTWLDHMGSVHSDALHVVERYTLVDNKTLKYQARLEDPKAFEKAWTITLMLKRARNDEELLEYACHEGNKSIENYTPVK